MSVRLPQNQIKFEYTPGGKYVEKSTYKDYTGYYYKVGSKIFAGKKFDSGAPVLIEKDNNTLTLNPQTSVYSAISGIKSTNSIGFKGTELSSVPLSPFYGIDKIHFFAKQVNSNPVRIFRISEEDYLANINKNTLYTFTKVKCDHEWGYSVTEQNLKEIPEIGIFLSQFGSFDE